MCLFPSESRLLLFFLEFCPASGLRDSSTPRSTEYFHGEMLGHMTTRPTEKLDVPVMGLQRALPFQFLPSLLRCCGGWLTDHAPQRRQSGPGHRVRKGDLKRFWDYTYEDAAKRFWQQWYGRAMRSRIEPLK